jgi:predicted RNase H-like HicB family nuclease
VCDSERWLTSRCSRPLKSAAAERQIVMPMPVDQALDVKWRQGIVMTMKLTAVFEKVPEGYIAFVEELPGANTQGTTMEEARSNLQEAVEMVLDANRLLAEETLNGRTVIREPFIIVSQ